MVLRQGFGCSGATLSGNSGGPGPPIFGCFGFFSLFDVFEPQPRGLPSSAMDCTLDGTRFLFTILGTASGLSDIPDRDLERVHIHIQSEVGAGLPLSRTEMGASVSDTWGASVSDTW